MITLNNPMTRAYNLATYKGLAPVIEYPSFDGVTVTFVYKPEATAQQIAAGDAICAATGSTSWRLKFIDKMRDDIVAGTTPLQRTAIWNDLKALVGGRAKILTTTGVNEIGMKIYQFLIDNVGGLTTNEKNEARVQAAAAYCQDNPFYLYQPAFDATINIPGDEPVPA